MWTLIISIAAALIFAGSIFLGWYFDRRWGRGARSGMSPEMEEQNASWSNRLYP